MQVHHKLHKLVSFLAVLRNSTGGAPYSIAVNDDSIYWTTITGAIYRIARVGKPRVTVVAYTGYATGQMILARKDYSNVDKGRRMCAEKNFLKLFYFIYM